MAAPVCSEKQVSQDSGDGGGVSPPAASFEDSFAWFIIFSIPQSTHFEASSVMEHSYTEKESSTSLSPHNEQDPRKEVASTMENA